MDPRSEGDRQVLGFAQIAEALPCGSRDWSIPANGGKLRITIALKPHPEHAEHELQFANGWQHAAQPAPEQQEMCDFYMAQSVDLLSNDVFEHRHNVEDMVKEALAPPKHVEQIAAASGDTALKVDEYYGLMKVMGNGVPQDMQSLGPVRNFGLSSLDKDPSSLQSGFEWKLSSFLDVEKAKKEEAATKSDRALSVFCEDWEALVQDTLEKARRIRRDMPKTLGFRDVNDLCTRILQVNDGLCDKSRIEFLDEQRKNEDELQACIAEVEKAEEDLENAQKRTVDINDLQALCYDVNAISGKDEVNAKDLRQRLKDEGFAVRPYEDDGNWYQDDVDKVRLIHVAVSVHQL